MAELFSRLVLMNLQCSVFHGQSWDERGFFAARPQFLSSSATAHGSESPPRNGKIETS